MDAPEPNAQNLDTVLAYLPVFEQEGHQFGEWVVDEGHLPWYRYSEEVKGFFASLHREGVVLPFDWPGWKQEAERYLFNPDALQSADLLTLRKLLFTHIRADRFTEGHLASVLESGHMLAILRRLKQIRNEMELR
jgi:O-acetyl-ADP-ribose deacetylase